MDENTSKTDAERWKLLRFKVLEGQIVECFQAFRREGIEPILIKGWAAGLFYPAHHQRAFSDFDLAVDPELFERAESAASRHRLTIDLHKGLSKLDQADWQDLFANSVLIDVGGTGIRVLRPEDHLRVLCNHWLTDGGVFREKLLDIYYLLTNRDESFDWNRCFGPVDRIGRHYVLVVIECVRKYYELDVSEFPFRNELCEIPRWMSDALEREWRENTPLRPLQTCLNDWQALKKQIRKRIPPNPVQATFDCGAEFDDSSRVRYQLRDTFKRLFPSVRRIARTIWSGEKY